MDKQKYTVQVFKNSSGFLSFDIDDAEFTLGIPNEFLPKEWLKNM